MIRINELMIMVALTTMVKVMILKNKNNNTTRNKCGNKNDHKAGHKHFL